MNTHLGDLTAQLIKALDEGGPTDQIVTAIGDAVDEARWLMETEQLGTGGPVRS